MQFNKIKNSNGIQQTNCGQPTTNRGNGVEKSNRCITNPGSTGKVDEVMKFSCLLLKKHKMEDVKVLLNVEQYYSKNYFEEE